MQALTKQPVSEVIMAVENSTPLARLCVKCGSSDRYKSGDCKQCASIRAAAAYQARRSERLAYASAYRAENKEKVTESQAAYKIANAEKIRDRSAKYRASLIPEKTKAYQAKYYLKNRDAIRASSADYKLKNPLSQLEYRKRNKAKLKENLAKWRFKNPEAMAKSAAAWAKANPEARRINEQNRRAKCKSSGVLSRGLTGKLLALQKGRCACCGLLLGKNFHLDHIMPLALGGTNTDDNIQLLRQRCNNKKYAKHPIDFMQEKGFLL